MKTNENETLWTATDLMNFLNCGKTSFFAAKRKGNLPPAIKIGKGLWRWQAETVQEWLKNKESNVSLIQAKTPQKTKISKRGRPTKKVAVESRR